MNSKDKFSIFRIDSSKQHLKDMLIDSMTIPIHLKIELRRKEIFTVEQLVSCSTNDFSYSESHHYSRKIRVTKQDFEILAAEVKKLGLKFVDEIIMENPQLLKDNPNWFYNNNPSMLISTKYNYKKGEFGYYNSTALKIFHNYETIEELINSTPEAWLKINGVGPKRIESVIELMHSYGLYLTSESKTKKENIDSDLICNLREELLDANLEHQTLTSQINDLAKKEKDLDEQAKQLVEEIEQKYKGQSYVRTKK